MRQGGSSGSGDSDGRTITFVAAKYDDDTQPYWAQLIKDFEARNAGLQGQPGSRRLGADGLQGQDVHPDQAAAGRPQLQQVLGLRPRRPDLPGGRGGVGEGARRLPAPLRRPGQVQRRPVRPAVHLQRAAVLLQQGDLQAGGPHGASEELGRGRDRRQEDQEGQEDRGHPARPAARTRGGPGRVRHLVDEQRRRLGRRLRQVGRRPAA